MSCRVPQVTLLMPLPQSLWQWREGLSLLSLGGVSSASGIVCPGVETQPAMDFLEGRPRAPGDIVCGVTDIVSVCSKAHIPLQVTRAIQITVPPNSLMFQASEIDRNLKPNQN